MSQVLSPLERQEMQEKLDPFRTEGLQTTTEDVVEQLESQECVKASSLFKSPEEVLSLANYASGWLWYDSKPLLLTFHGGPNTWGEKLVPRTAELLRTSEGNAYCTEVVGGG